jgi:hypothetical protein
LNQDRESTLIRTTHQPEEDSQMNLKSKIATLVLAATVAFGAASPALANDANTKVTQEITAGTVLKAELLPTSTLTAMPFSQTAQTSKGTLNVKIEDSRGTNGGWNVTLQAGEFSPGSGLTAPAISSKGFVFVNGGGVTASAGKTDNIQTGGQNAPLDTAKRVVYAPQGFGTGIFTQSLNVSLDIPAGQLVGEYQSDITVNITSGPGQ